MEDCEIHERDFKEATLPHFLKGISSILSFLVLAVSVGGKDLSESDSKQLKSEIELAQRETLAAEEAASGIVDLIDAGCEKLTAQHGKLSKEQKELQESIKSMHNQLAGLKNQRQRITGQVQTAKVWLKQADQTLRAARAKKREKQTGRDIGIGLSFVIPCIGIPMAVAFEKERMHRKSEVDIASEDLSQLRASITKDEEVLDQLNRQIPEMKKETEKAAQTLSGVKTELLKIKRSGAALGKAQSKLKNCSQYLCTLHGRVSALKAQTQHMYSLGPLIPFIDETCAHIQQQVPGSELLLTGTQVHKVMDSLKCMLPKLKENNLSDKANYM
ncbi:cingulin-like [Heptranchias perlo]|uniref:cingulin-like n=1 Tax=Heptranchias perlo TaxID=212740 RepID=UPI00355A4308